MLSKFILSILLTFSFAIEWVDYNGYKINSKVIVIKINNNVRKFLISKFHWSSGYYPYQ